MPGQVAERGAAGRQHVRRGFATILLLAPALLLAVGIPWTGGEALAQPVPTAEPAAVPAPGGYIQRGVPADATAEDAVQARERAYASAQRVAYERMARELGLPLNLSAGQIDGLVRSVVVEQERATRTGFSGRVTVNFDPRRVAALGGRPPAGGGGVASGGTPAGDGRPAPLAVAAPASAFVEAAARYGSLPEWLDLRRRLLASPQVASVEIRAISVDRARIRVGLRAPAPIAGPELSAQGVAVVPATDGTWQVGLAGGA